MHFGKAMSTVHSHECFVHHPREVAVDSTVIVLIIVVVLLVIALGAAGAMLARRRRSENLQEHYGPEYERTVIQTGDRRAAEAQLTEREKRHRELEIRDLKPEERDLSLIHI